jgi:predicted nucleic acid-binding protein
LSGLVVDASVGLKWYIDEPQAATARLLLQGENDLSVPHLFFTEIGAVLGKRYRRREISAWVVVATLEAVEEVPVQVWPDRDLLWDGLAIALRCGCSVYDALYLALADHIDGRLVTADRRLVNAMAGTEWRSGSSRSTSSKGAARGQSSGRPSQS